MSAHKPSTEFLKTAPVVVRREDPRLPAELEVPADPGRDTVSPVLTGRMVSFRFIRKALRRGRRIWLSAAVLGLVVGLGYHFVVPLKHGATSTVYLSHPSLGATEMQTELSFLDTPSVGKRAIALLGAQGRGLTWQTLLGSDPGTASSGNILTITVWGTSSEQAVLRVNAVAKAYMTFRAQQYEKQNAAEVVGARAQIATLQKEVKKLNAEIATLTTSGSSAGVASLESERATATTEIASLEGTVQTDNLNLLSVVNGSRIITPGTAIPTSHKKALLLDGFTGLIGALGAALLGIVLYAVLSERLRRREDVAAVLGAPVALSIGRVRKRFMRGSIVAMAATPSHDLGVLVHKLRSYVVAKSWVLTKNSGGTLVVALDDVDVPAAGLLALAKALAREGKKVVLVDATASHSLSRALGPPDLEPGRPGSTVTLLVASRPWEGEKEDRWPYSDRDMQSDGDSGHVMAVEHGVETFLVLATVDPRVGAWHLRRWASEAVVTVTAGECSAERLAVVSELLEAAGLAVSSVVLLDSDSEDESVGLPYTNGHGARIDPVAKRTFARST